MGKLDTEIKIKNREKDCNSLLNSDIYNDNDFELGKD